MNNRPVLTGNLAYRLDEEERGLTKQSANHTHAAVQRKQAAKKVNLAVILFYIVIIGAMAFCLISREVKIYAKNSQIAQMQSELSGLQAQSKQLSMEAEAELDFKEIEQTAVSKYNMSRPETHQIVYVNLPQNDYIETSAKKSEKSFTQKVLGIIKKW